MPFSVQQCVVTSDAGNSSNTVEGITVSDWMPLLLIVPLRLGLSEINPVYMNGLKVNTQLNYTSILHYIFVTFKCYYQWLAFKLLIILRFLIILWNFIYIHSLDNGNMYIQQMPPKCDL